jgi:hypothetical protein
MAVHAELAPWDSLAYEYCDPVRSIISSSPSRDRLYVSTLRAARSGTTAASTSKAPDVRSSKAVSKDPPISIALRHKLASNPISTRVSILPASCAVQLEREEDKVKAPRGALEK